MSAPSRFWHWWKRCATGIAVAVYLDPPIQRAPRRQETAPMRLTEKLGLLLVVAILAGWLAWQLAIGSDSIRFDGRDAWIRENPGTFGLVVAVLIYLVGMLTIVAIDRRDSH